MNISAFFRFPGILITIGVVLLIVSIVIIILAIKSDKKEDFKISEDFKKIDNDDLPSEDEKVSLSELNESTEEDINKENNFDDDSPNTVKVNVLEEVNNDHVEEDFTNEENEETILEENKNEISEDASSDDKESDDDVELL